MGQGRGLGRAWLLLGGLWAILSLFPNPLGAARILFYYNSSDGTDGAILQCASILREAGHEVSVRDVAGKSYDPTDDNWGPPYDQVWDARFVDRNSEACGSGIPQAADYFDTRWKSKAVSFLNHCGKLFVAGENYQLVDRDEGLYLFLRQVEAVNSRFDSCAPSPEGNSSTDGTAYYGVQNGLGPVSFFGAWVGGIPMDCLTGTSFVRTSLGWKGNDQVDRSIVSGWEGGQLGGKINAPECSRGKLFVVWDASMWPLWKIQPETSTGRIDFKRAKTATEKFFPLVARWLGGRDCPCGTLEPSAGLETPMENHPVVLSGNPRGRGDSGLYAGSPGKPPEDLLESQPLVFSEPPVNIYVRFADGPGRYRLEVQRGGAGLKFLLDQEVGAPKEEWVQWDGLDGEGNRMGPGGYEAVLYKDGKILKKIALTWVHGAP